jgi:hypothetical protein
MPIAPCVTCASTKRIACKGECYSCYMRRRRANSRASNARRANGATLQQLMSYPDQEWRHKILGRIDPTPTATGCHEWFGTKTKGGYGIITVAGVNILAHRAIHAFSGGDANAAVVMHTCDNPGCCNPAHLKGGSYSENMQDMHAKGRVDRTSLGHHLRDRESHPRGKRIATPMGEFASAALAAEQVGLHYKTVLGLANKRKKGFYWIEAPTSPEAPACRS